MPTGNFILRQYQWALECVQGALLGLSGGLWYIFGKDPLSLSALGRALDCSGQALQTEKFQEGFRDSWGLKGFSGHGKEVFGVGSQHAMSPWSRELCSCLKLKISWVRTCQK